MNSYSGSGVSISYLAEIQTIAPVPPLDAQFAAPTKLDTPGQLAELVFPATSGQQTFALLDAAIVPLLPELLLASGLEHKCLFTNDALDQIGMVGPWLVRLEANNDFTRNLFTHIPDKETGWHLWGKNAGIFVQSDKGFEAVWKHFRKLVRVQNADQSWFLFRFWDPQIAAGFWPIFPDNQTEVARRYGLDVLKSVFWQAGDSFHVVRVETPATIAKHAPSLVETYNPSLKEIRWDRFCNRVCQSAKSTEPSLQNISDARFRAFCDRAKARGFRRERAIYELVLAYAICASLGENFEEFHRAHLPAGQFPDDLSAARSLLAKARKMHSKELENG